MSAVKAAAAHIDWPKLSTSLGLKTETVAALSAFRKRNEEARRVLADLKEQKTTVDFAHYRKVLKNQAIVDEVEKSFKGFKPATYDVQAQIKSIEAVEAKAVRSSHQFIILSWFRKKKKNGRGHRRKKLSNHERTNLGNEKTKGSYIIYNLASNQGRVIMSQDYKAQEQEATWETKAIFTRKLTIWTYSCDLS